MTRIINQPIETKVQVLDSSGDPANSATVSYKIYDNNDELDDSGTMTFIADGLYTIAWTPGGPGEWTVEVESANPKFHKSFTYYVEDGVKYTWKQQAILNDSQEPPTLNEWYTILDVTGGAMLQSLAISQGNTGGDPKDVEVEVTLDDLVMSGTLSVPTTDPLYVIHNGETLFSHAVNVSSAAFGRYIQAYNVTAAERIDDVVPEQGCHHLTIRYRLTSAPGSSQSISARVHHKTYDVVEVAAP